jgi:hypothetical protein
VTYLRRAQAALGVIGRAGQRFVWITGPQGRIASLDSDVKENSAASVMTWARAWREDVGALAYANSAPDFEGPLVRTEPSAAVTIPAGRRTVLAPGERMDDPWLRSIVIAPSVQDTMRVAVIGPTDYRSLQPLLTKPRAVVAMGFSVDPRVGLVSQSFEGAAVAFVPTVIFTFAR